MKPRQICRHVANAVFKLIFLNENAWIHHKISPKFVPKIIINIIPLYEPMILVYSRKSASPSPSELIYMTGS